MLKHVQSIMSSYFGYRAVHMGTTWRKKLRILEFALRMRYPLAIVRLPLPAGFDIVLFGS